MTTLLILLFATFVLGFIIKIQMHFHKSKVQHLATISSLQKQISDLVEIRKTLYQQVSIIDHFATNYRKSNEKIAREIFALQYQLLKAVSENL